MLDGVQTEVITEVKEGFGVYEIANALSPAECQHLIDTFETHPEDQYQGVAGPGVDLAVKRSKDMVIREQDYCQEADRVLFKSLSVGLKLLGTKNEFFHKHTVDDNGYQIQRTNPGEFYHWHYDNDAPNGSLTQSRVMVAIWYLNTLEDRQGGRTQFKHQKLSIVPEAGKLIFFPPYHTHVHRCETLAYGQKYIATTWMVRAE